MYEKDIVQILYKGSSIYTGSEIVEFAYLLKENTLVLGGNENTSFKGTLSVYRVTILDSPAYLFPESLSSALQQEQLVQSCAVPTSAISGKATCIHCDADFVV